MGRPAPCEDDASSAGAAPATHVTVKAGYLGSRCRPLPALSVLLVGSAALLAAASATPAAPNEPVWIDPCGIHSYAPSNVTMKSVKRALAAFRAYLANAINNVSKEWQRASGLYTELTEDQFPIEMEWLPRNQFNHYKDNVRGMKLPEKLVHIVQHVHDGVQKYLATVVWLQGDEASNLLTNKDHAKRADFLSRIRGKLRSLQCVAQKAIVDSRERLVVQRLQIGDLVDAEAFPQPSETAVQMLQRDRAFLSQLTAFLRDWQRVVAIELRAIRKDKPGTGARRRERTNRHRRLIRKNP